MKIYNNITELVGNTPLISLKNIAKSENINAELIAKVEYFNPAGSAKDRVALSMIDEAEKNGTLKKSSVIIEPTSGNTGIAIAMAASVKGYRCIIVMPESMSVERQKLIRAYNAEIVLTPAKEGMSGAIKKADEIAAQTENAVIAGQFVNPANPNAHYKTTGPEIWRDTDGKVDIFVAGAGTGGTVTGVGRYLKEHKPDVKIIAAEPADSPVLSSGKAGAHKIQGIGAGFVPKILDTKIYDEVVAVTNEEAFLYAQKLRKEEGLLCGISSGAALCAAVKIAKRDENNISGKSIVVLLPDSGERYFSVDGFID